ncbi:ribonuclease T2-like [Halichoeres trimaculatus]|uniref:ribonuclease T2-like n=1 Tax=Halichoeres trimaculatus TaxID=147232 RepID=UPI003D9EE0CB
MLKFGEIRSEMSSSVLPLLVSLSFAVLLLPDFTEARDEDYGYGGQDTKKPFCSWKCLLFTLQWPAGFCQSLNNGSLCSIPQRINNWTIHGLWPQRAWGCCDCWRMFPSDIQEVEAELNEHWPSLLKSRSSFYFWSEEWNKHGACAACVEGLNSPLRYFQIGLKLRRQFDIHRVLEAAGVTPSCQRAYKVSEVHQVLAPHLGEEHEIQCVTDHQDREVWFQVKILLSHNLTLGCGHRDGVSGPERPPSSGHPCSPHAPFYYFPIDHQRPLRPCD